MPLQTVRHYSLFFPTGWIWLFKAPCRCKFNLLFSGAKTDVLVLTIFVSICNDLLDWVLPQYLKKQKGFSPWDTVSLKSGIREWLYQLTFTPQCRRVPLLHIPSNSGYLEFLMMTIQTSVRWPIMCISPTIRNVEHLSMNLLTICILSLEKCLFRSSAHFLIRLFFLLFSCMGHLYIFEVKPRVNCVICKYFILLCRLSFLFVYVFPCCVKSSKFD